jgi:hypothetical protein
MDSILYRLFSVSMAISAHILAAGLLMLVGIEIKTEEESPTFVRLVPGWGGGEETKVAVLEKPGDPASLVKAPDPDPPKPEAQLPKPEAPEAPAAANGPVEAARPAPGRAASESPPAPNPGPGLDGPPGAAVLGAGTSTGAGPGGTDGEIERDPTEAIRRRRAGSLAGLRGGSDRAILVVSGVYDRVQDILDKLGIPHRTIEPEALAGQDLSRCRAVLVNCDKTYAADLMKDVTRQELERAIVGLEGKLQVLRQRKESTADKMARYRIDLDLLKTTSQLEEAARLLAASGQASRVVKNLSEFIAGGGYVFTSDWGLTLVERAAPGYVKSGGLVGPRTVSIRARAGNEAHPLLTEVFLEPSRGTTRVARRFEWEIDSASYSINILKPEAVEVLVEAPEVPQFPAVAVSFRHEKGRVLHVLSHFQKQATKHGDYALQNMLLNFLIEKWEGKVPPAAPSAGPEPLPLPAPPPAKLSLASARGLSMPVPEGWTAREGEGEVAMAIEGPKARGEVTVGRPDTRLAAGLGSWDSLLKSAQKEATVIRRVQAVCRGCPALIVTWSFPAEPLRSAVQTFIAAPDAFYTVTWTCASSDLPGLESTFERCGRGLEFPRK